MTSEEPNTNSTLDLFGEGPGQSGGLASIYFRYFATYLIHTQFRKLRWSTHRTFYKTKFLRMSPELRGIEIRLYFKLKAYKFMFKSCSYDGIFFNRIENIVGIWWNAGYHFP